MSLPIYPKPYVRPQDNLDLEINPVTGELDLISDFNTGRILTSEYIHTGQKRLVWDSASNTYFAENPVVVIDNEGNVVKV